MSDFILEQMFEHPRRSAAIFVSASAALLWMMAHIDAEMLAKTGAVEVSTSVRPATQHGCAPTAKPKTP